ncbi:molybdate ABC transporter permease subunit [Cytobacillus solani]|uniref:Molybdenum transport system permease n=1 Tax=Cytobacillus solani TaxID=1637975 RepID=A0A0Q3VHD1_9BACI|nr:molybdate ABC transporter permease subunit [Cytobacillus solani]KOP82567.1 molybdenum ABC transporter permease [Bacillus sp. FJAT-21945]KQL19579.1 molybdenum ABC transporter permease [Cytobacillus solani]USK52804.1 molybdate ABC transporter permease subunit [Cytobacillus solani]
MNDSFFLPVQLSLKIAFVSLIIVFILGILLAKFMVKKKFKGKVIAETILLLPLVLPPTVIGFLLIVFFGNTSPVSKWIEWIFDQPVMFTWWAGVIASTVVALPLMYQSAKTGFSTIDPAVEEAARVDGAGEWKVFLLVTMPLAYHSLISGAILSFARALGEFGATLMFAGNIPGKTQTMSTAIYMSIESGNMKLAWLLVLTMILISFFMLLIVTRIK